MADGPHVTTMGLFIPHQKLENLRLYKYSLEDHLLILRHVLKRWWNWFVQVFPMLMAPNVITLAGLGFVVVSVAVVLYHDPYFDTPQPLWCYFFHAFALFMYQTFDGCDGCHARRTGQSGPLGELFDHSIDAVNTTLGVLVFGSVFQMGWLRLLLFAQLGSVCNFYASTWEEYHTHTLYLLSFSGPVEGILIVCLLFVLTGFTGPQIWNAHLVDVDLAAVGVPMLVEVRTTHLYVFAGVAQLYFNIAAAMRNVARKYAQGPAAAARRNRQAAYKGLVPFFSYYAGVAALVYGFPDILPDFGFPLVVSIGMTVAFCVGRIILAHLTLQEFPFVNVPTFLPPLQLVVGKVVIYGFNYAELLVLPAIMWTGVGLTLAYHGMFVTEVIMEITTYLDIYALSIKHKKI